MASSAFLLILSDGSLPNGSSPDFRKGLRHCSRISRNAPLLARSPKNPSSSLSSILKLSTSTDGRRVAPCRPMPEVVKVSSAMLPLPAGGRRDNGCGTRWFHGRSPSWGGARLFGGRLEPGGCASGPSLETPRKGAGPQDDGVCRPKS